MSATATALLRPAPPWDRPALAFGDGSLSALIAGWAAAALSRLPVELLAGRLSVVVVSVLPAVAPSPRLAEDDIARGSTKDRAWKIEQGVNIDRTQLFDSDNMLAAKVQTIEDQTIGAK
jgi:hypothetical protein